MTPGCLARPGEAGGRPVVWIHQPLPTTGALPVLAGAWRGPCRAGEGSQPPGLPALLPPSPRPEALCLVRASCARLGARWGHRGCAEAGRGAQHPWLEAGGGFQPPPCYSSALLSASGLLNPRCIQPDTWQRIRWSPSSVLACPQPRHRLGDLGRAMLPRGAVPAPLLPDSGHLLPQRQVLPVPEIVAGDTSVSPECLLRATARPPSDKLRP